MRMNRMISSGFLTIALAIGSVASAQTPTNPTTKSDPAAAAAVQNLPLDKLVVDTCRQAWQQGGRTPDGFFAIVQRLAELSAQNRGVTLPDDQAAGARAGQWIRTQALKDPDQLLYAIVDQAVQHSIDKGRATPVSK